MVAILCLLVWLSPGLGAQSSWVPKVRAWITANEQPVMRELLDLLAIPNVAADRPNIRRNAEHLRGLFQKRGFTAELLETDGNPLVYAELKVPGATRTLLLYSHYDGQPVDPKGWRQPDPFTPVVHEGRIYARSASDDKSPIIMTLAAIDALKASGTAPTSNIRVILDGEEEAGSPSLVQAIAKYRDRLGADLMVILDGPQHSSGRPTIAYGARGIARVDITVFGPKVGVHSGNYGNWVPNPAQRLARLLASMKDDDGRVLVEGWHDGIAPLAPEEQAMVAAVPDDTAAMLRAFGVAAPEAAHPKLQAALQYPTLNVRGMTSAFVGAGARTIIPDRATASIRRAPGEGDAGRRADRQDPRPRPQPGLPHRPGGARRRDAGEVPEDRAAGNVRGRHERVPDVTAGPAGAGAGCVDPSGDRHRARSPADARRHCPDRTIHRSAGISGRAGADGQLRQQPA